MFQHTEDNDGEIRRVAYVMMAAHRMTSMWLVIIYKSYGRKEFQSRGVQRDLSAL